MRKIAMRCTQEQFESIKDRIKLNIFDGLNWHEIMHSVRIKPQTNYSKEIEALQLKAKENGMKCVINFEKI